MIIGLEGTFRLQRIEGTVYRHQNELQMKKCTIHDLTCFPQKIR
jgi:hypothetical protein